MKKLIVLMGLALILLSLNACIFSGGTSKDQNALVATITPSSGYRPLEITIVAKNGVEGGQFKLEIEGKTKENSTGMFSVTVYESDSTGTLTWTKPGYANRTAIIEIGFNNEGPIIGTPRLNGLADLWTLHPRHRYIVDFPDAYDPEGGPVTLVDAHVQVARKQQEDTVFCPPYEGPGVYHAFDRNRRLIENAFVFHSTWTGPIDTGTTYPEWVQSHSYKVANRIRVEQRVYTCIKKHVAMPINQPTTGTSWQVFWVQSGWIDGTNLPFSPPGYGESGYPGNGWNCPVGWSTSSAPATTTKITVTFRDEAGAETTESWDIYTSPDPGCNTFSLEE